MTGQAWGFVQYGSRGSKLDIKLVEQRHYRKRGVVAVRPSVAVDDPFVEGGASVCLAEQMGRRMTSFYL